MRTLESAVRVGEAMLLKVINNQYTQHW
jgi:hypothetical protein